MFGIFRTALAMVVVAQHFGNVGAIGELAVSAFFVLSGFLMTLLVTTTYRDRQFEFLLNRALKLYPSYWFVILITIVLIYMGFHGTRKDIGIPEGFLQFAADIFYINYWHEPKMIIITSWAVTNEIIMYILIAWGISYTMSRTILWLIVSALVSAAIFLCFPGNRDLNYFLPSAASLPFAIGATAFHFRDRISAALGGIPPLIVSLPIMLAIFGVCALKPSWQIFAPTAFELSTALAVVGLYEADSFRSNLVHRIDEAIGRLSYPIYLNQFAAGMIVAAVMPFEKGTVFAAATLAAAIGIGVITFLLVD